jgi:non-heme chloroperoxidase
VPDRYPAIEDHAVIGYLHTVALVATDGTIDWSACRGSTRQRCSRPCWTPTAAAASRSVPIQAATANINPFTEAKVDSKNPRRGPVLIITGKKDHIAPHAVASASCKKQKRNRAATDIHEIPDRDRSLVFDSGWQDVAETALAFIKKSH